mgnify:FL=1
MTDAPDLFAPTDTDPEPVAAAPEASRAVRVIEAALFMAGAPGPKARLREIAGDGADVDAVLLVLRDHYAGRGVNLIEVPAGFTFRTAPDLAEHLHVARRETRRLSQAALETVAIIAYAEKPVTRAEIEAVRGVAVSKGTLDVLLELEWVKPSKTLPLPGRPVAWGVTPTFFDHFGLSGREALPGLGELRQAGFFGPDVPIMRLGPEQQPDETAERGAV